MTILTVLPQNLALQGARVRALRYELDYTAAEVARQAQVSLAYLYRLERDAEPLAPGITVAKLALVLETTLDYLYGLSERKLK